MQGKKGIVAIVVAVIAVIVIAILLLKGCAVKEYKVTFDSNGGSAVSSQTVKEGETVTEPEDPTREGYTFAGWYLNINDTNPYNFNTKVTKNITLHAKWAEAMQGDDECTLTCESGYTLDKENCKCVKTEEVKVTGVKANKTSLTLTVGETYKVKLTITPSNATNKTATWKSSNTKVVTVDKNGKITAKGVGTATVTATVDGKTVEIKVTVKAKPAQEPTTPTTPSEPEPENVLVTGITVNGKTEMDWNTDQKLTATISPENATNKEVTWSTSNANVATVDQNGNVHAVGEGDVVITATAKDGSGVTGSITIHVSAVYSIILTSKELGANMGSLQYTYAVYRNGVAMSTNDYTGFVIGNLRATSTRGTITKEEVADKLSTATLTLKNGTKVTASVEYR